jgi:hypothetical protein
MRHAAPGLALGALVLLGIAAPADAQPGTHPATALENFHRVSIGNGLLTAQVYPPGENQLYRGTRFDHAGVVFHVTYKGQDYNSYWFDRFLTDPTVTAKQPPYVQTACCAVSGPVEEFAAVGFEQAGMGGRFLKPGIGIFKRDNDDPLRFPTLPALNEGTRSFQATSNSARFTQVIDDPQSGYGYRYEKVITLVPGKAQMTISHVLTNAGRKRIDTSVYCHNFLTLSPGNDHLRITAPFAIKPQKPLNPRIARVDGKTIRYIAPIPAGETEMSLIDGFNNTAGDYDFTVTNTKTGFGQRIRGDQPIVKINMWSIDRTYSLEPYIAIALKPGESKRWTYTYDFFGPGETGAKP